MTLIGAGRHAVRHVAEREALGTPACVHLGTRHSFTCRIPLARMAAWLVLTP